MPLTVQPLSLLLTAPLNRSRTGARWHLTRHHFLSFIIVCHVLALSYFGYRFILNQRCAAVRLQPGTQESRWVLDHSALQASCPGASGQGCEGASTTFQVHVSVLYPLHCHCMRAMLRTARAPSLHSLCLKCWP